MRALLALEDGKCFEDESFGATGTRIGEICFNTAMTACLTTEKMSIENAVQRAVEGEGVIGMDYVREVSTPEIYRWDPDDKLSQPWSIANGNGDNKPKLPPIRFRIVAYDYGIKQNILRLLRQKGFGVTVLPASTSAEQALALNPDGIFLSNGPGDPAA